ncbi:MAG: STAS domain-containing protein [Terracidiphilus sp.]
MNHSMLGSTIEVVSGVRELVRGQEQAFLADLRPLVRSQSLLLDIRSVQRIDAAGLAALVSLYCDARHAGHEFAVVHPSRHVTRILALVGLDRILVPAKWEDEPQHLRQENDRVAA